MSMTKADLVEAVSQSINVSKREAEVVVNTFLECVVGALNRGEGVELRGFGSFRIRERGPRTGRNPRTGESVEVAPKKVPYFKVGKQLKELINVSN
ncbi:HU family DNA-binding protein [Acanthopleuribacter pedis]|uniref:HU family DNA-binding protein n=2 Tax=Acanthopleuribacter pedis TaxID=442870 RepID=A0A8J7U485_9BACT|nr:HU family DNA-binding protein [Acanthopleuribacter pedis]